MTVVVSYDCINFPQNMPWLMSWCLISHKLNWRQWFRVGVHCSSAPALPGSVSSEGTLVPSDICKTWVHKISHLFTSANPSQIHQEEVCIRASVQVPLFWQEEKHLVSRMNLVKRTQNLSLKRSLSYSPWFQTSFRLLKLRRHPGR